MSSSSPASAKTQAAASYHPQGYKVSPALQRTRSPFLYRNAITGAVVVTFIAGVFAYSIGAVKQEDFGDVEDLLPPPSQRATLKTIEEELAEKKRSIPRTQSLPMDSNTSRTSDALPPLLGSTNPNPALGPGSLETVLPLPTPPSAASDLNARTPSTSPFRVYTSETPKANATYTEEEQYAMFKLPFFKGKAHRAGVDVDRIGSMWDKWA